MVIALLGIVLCSSPRPNSAWLLAVLNVLLRFLTPEQALTWKRLISPFLPSSQLILVCRFMVRGALLALWLDELKIWLTLMQVWCGLWHWSPWIQDKFLEHIGYWANPFTLTCVVWYTGTEAISRPVKLPDQRCRRRRCAGEKTVFSQIFSHLSPGTCPRLRSAWGRVLSGQVVRQSEEWISPCFLFHKLQWPYIHFAWGHGLSSLSAAWQSTACCDERQLSTASPASQGRGWSCSAPHVWPHFEYCEQFWAPQ